MTQVRRDRTREANRGHHPAARIRDPEHRDSRAITRVVAPTYDLRASQVATPLEIVKFFWMVVKTHRPQLGTVLDIGAGDGRFSRFGHYRNYTGIEIDPARIVSPSPRKNAKVQHGCVFSYSGPPVNACIGNPPYLRHHDIESPWKETTLARLSQELGCTLDGHANLFLYFMALGLLRTRPDGLAALVVPFDWVSRPSGKGIREAVNAKRWNVSVYRFTFPVFDGVDTTASVSIIDKAVTEGRWRYFDIRKDLTIAPRRGVTGTGRRILRYVRRKERGRLFARRGLSPGTQSVFTLTEGERVHHGLHRDDVVPCVTTVRGIEEDLRVLDRATFERLFVKGGRRCWLIKSKGPLSPRLKEYLDSVPVSARSTATCRNQEPWYDYEDVSPPKLLFHSSFTSREPRVLVNSVRAIQVGTMYGIYGCTDDDAVRVRDCLSRHSIVARVVPHSRRLRKIEVSQLNGILATLEHATDG
jgi:hypothetical protein